MDGRFVLNPPRTVNGRCKEASAATDADRGECLSFLEAAPTMWPIAKGRSQGSGDRSQKRHETRLVSSPTALTSAALRACESFQDQRNFFSGRWLNEPVR